MDRTPKDGSTGGGIVACGRGCCLCVVAATANATWEEDEEEEDSKGRLFGKVSISFVVAEVLLLVVAIMSFVGLFVRLIMDGTSSMLRATIPLPLPLPLPPSGGFDKLEFDLERI